MMIQESLLVAAEWLVFSLLRSSRVIHLELRMVIQEYAQIHDKANKLKIPTANAHNAFNGDSRSA